MKSSTKWLCLLGSIFTFTLLLYLFCHFPERMQSFSSLRPVTELCKLSPGERVDGLPSATALRPALRDDTDRLVSMPSHSKSAPLNPHKPIFYLIIDDVGSDQSLLSSFLELTFPITFAIMPYTRSSQDDYNKILEAKQEPILHMPMQPLNGSFAGKGQIEVGDSTSIINQKLKQALATFPCIKGFNNHMGSAVTSSPCEVGSLLDYVHTHKLFFIDSYTTSQSVCKQIAEEKGIRIARRDIFLDNLINYEAINVMLEKALKLAFERGYVIVIGHVWCAPLVQLLQDREKELKDLVQFAPISHYFERDA